MKKLALFLALSVLLSSGLVFSQDDAPTVPALLETTPSPNDGANAPIIWLHPRDPSLSVIVGTDDNGGIGIYDLNGDLLSFHEEDRFNSIDLRYNFPMGDETIVLIAAGVKGDKQINLYTIDPDSRELVRLSEFDTQFDHAGLALYHSAETEIFYIFNTSNDGNVEQHSLAYDGEEWVVSLVREFAMGGQTEGMTADDELGNLFISEEEEALWRFEAEPNASSRPVVVDRVGRNIEEEVEGLGIYDLGNGRGYLIAANEKADTFNVYTRDGSAFIGSFEIDDGDEADDVDNPGGFDVIGVPLGDLFPGGLFVASDEDNGDPDDAPNFKLASWADIAEELDLEMNTDLSPYDTPAPVEISATAETEAVPTSGDAADDPAIWIHPTDTSQSTIIGTDKNSSLIVYNLDGSILQTLELGRINNVDLRYNFPLGDQSVAIVTATNLSDNSVVIYAVDPETRQLVDVAARTVVSEASQVYGICMYNSPHTGDTYTILTSKDGVIEQYRLFDDGADLVDAELVRTLQVASQPEGCVADDELAFLYIGEETEGIWKFDAEPDASSEPLILVDHVHTGGHLTADVEGLTLYYGSNGSGYLIASSQGSSEFVVYDRAGNNPYLGTFVVIQSFRIDDASGSDGIDVTNVPLGDAFPAGMLVTQDYDNTMPDDNQNFKMISWADIAAGLDLMIDTDFDPRTVGAD